MDENKYSEDSVSIDSELAVFEGRNVAAATEVVVMDSAVATGKDCDCYW